MARFELSGFDDVLDEMKRLGELSGDVADRMLMAGAEVVKKEWKASAERSGHRDTGDMIASINYARKPKTAGDIRTIDIYPQGKDSKGVRNAEKAFILNYGTKTRKASQWVDKADQASGEPVMQAMTKIWDEHLKGMK
jgi:hypothetical protein